MVAKPLYEILSDGRYLIHLDHHKLSTFTTCERLFDFVHLRNQRRKGGLAFNTSVGIWWSAVMSDLYEGIAENQAQGLNKPPSIVSVITSAASNWKKYNMDRLKQDAPQKYAKFGGTHTITTALSAGNPVELPTGALTMAQEYYESRAEADAKDWKIIATETAFGVLDDLIIGQNSKVIVAYQGRPDIIALDYRDRLMPLDHKTKDYPDPAALLFEYKPHPQTAGYVYCLNQLVNELGVKNRTVDRCMMIVSGRFTPSEPRSEKTAKKPRFYQVQVAYSQAELNEWREQTVGKATRLREAIERHLLLMKESSCHYQYGSPCEFRPVCSQPPGVREMILKRDYVEIKPWNPAEPDTRNTLK